MKIRRNIVTHERKEARNGVGGVAIPNELVKDGMVVEDVGKKRGPGVDGDYGEDADNVVLFIGSKIIQSLHYYVPDGNGDGNGGQNIADGEGEELDSGLIFPEREGDFKDEFV